MRLKNVIPGVCLDRLRNARSTLEGRLVALRLGPVTMCRDVAHPSSLYFVHDKHHAAVLHLAIFFLVLGGG